MRDLTDRVLGVFLLFLLWASIPLVILAGALTPIVLPFLLLALVLTLPIWVAAGLIAKWRRK